MARAKRNVAEPISLPCPTGGWNARDSLSAMSPLDAVVLTNWFPATTECVLRSGYTNQATGITGQVETLMAYSGGNVNKLFAIAGGSVYDVSATGPVGSAVKTGLTNSRFQYANIATAGGNFLVMANAVDTPQVYNGTTWTNIAVTGVTATSLNSPVLYMNRLFFIQDNSLKTWYLPTSSIGGAANPIDVSAYMTKGGEIVAHGTWTIDAGNGVNDHYVIITDQGQVIVFQGTDPSTAATWAMVGVWDIGAPVGARSMYKYAGDILLITQDGVVPLSGALQSSRVQPRVALTDKIQYAISQAVTAYSGNFGWQLMYVPTINQLWLNVPTKEGSEQNQYAMNTITGSWCNYTGWNANCFEMFNDEPYFGGDGYVARAWNSQADNGLNITAFAIQAFNNFQRGGQLKRFTMSRPIFRSDGAPSVYAGINIDFTLNDTTTPLTYTPIQYSKWDTGVWDNATWGGGVNTFQYWQGLNGVGYFGAPVVKAVSNLLDVRWVSTDIVIESGGIL